MSVVACGLRRLRSGGKPAPFPRGPLQRFRAATPIVVMGVLAACADPDVGQSEPRPAAADLAAVRSEVEAMVWTFHAANTARNADAVADLLWPDYEMLVDGQRVSYEEIAAGSREFMAGLETLHTVWTDLEILPLTRNLALSSFTFRDSIVTVDGELTRTRGPTTLLWERRDGEWRMRYGDADHYPISP